MAKSAKSLSPVNQLTTPPLLSKPFDNSTNAKPAVVDAVTAAASIPATTSPYFFIASPNTTICSPNLSRSLLPVNQLTTPPVFGTVLASSVKANPAVADAVTASPSIPATASPYAFIASPNGTICSAKVSRSLLPVNQLTTPPVLGTVLASSVNALPAIVDACIDSELIPATESPYNFIASPNGTSCSAKSPKSLFPANQLTTPPVFGTV